ncbi:MAG: alpha/beta hydrolase [Oscillospiraceae bacterium]
MKSRKLIAVCVLALMAPVFTGGCSGSQNSTDSSTEIISETTAGTEKAADYAENIFEDITVKKDIVYAVKKDCKQTDTELKLDVYSPVGDTETKRPVIIWVHGGGMYTGGKDESWEPVAVLASEFAHKGYVCISADYRLDPEWEATGAFNETMKNAAEDVASAIEWVRENSETYGMDSGRIALGGYSSGAEIVDNFYFSNFLTDEKNVDKSGIKAVISISGNRLFYDKAACSGDESVKCLILHGEADDINPLSDAETFLSQLGDRGEMKTMPGNSHFWLDNDEQMAFLEDNITDFLLREVIKT